MSCLSYTNNNLGFTFHIPIHLQRLMMKEYCTQKKLSPAFEHNELDSMFHLPVLMDLVEKKENIELVLFSIYSLPKETETLSKLLKICKERKIRLHFANEGFALYDDQDEQKLMSYLEF